jgi:hypothetical protein
VAVWKKGIKDYPDWEKNVLNWLVLALAHQRLGQAGERTQLLQKADRWIAAQQRHVSPRTSFVPRGWSWRNWMMVQLVRREGEGFSHGTDKDKGKWKGK